MAVARADRRRQMAPRTLKTNAASSPPADENEAPKPRRFKLREPAAGVDDADAVIRVSFGHSPRISIGAGDVYVTDDAKLAERLAANPHLEEIKS
jgi:hypothetical protein